MTAPERAAEAAAGASPDCDPATDRVPDPECHAGSDELKSEPVVVCFWSRPGGVRRLFTGFTGTPTAGTFSYTGGTWQSTLTDQNCPKPR